MNLSDVVLGRAHGGSCMPVRYQDRVEFTHPIRPIILSIAAWVVLAAFAVGAIMVWGWLT